MLVGLVMQSVEALRRMQLHSQIQVGVAAPMATIHQGLRVPLVHQQNMHLLTRAEGAVQMVSIHPEMLV